MKTLMLIPIDDNVGISTISLGLERLFSNYNLTSELITINYENTNESKINNLIDSIREQDYAVDILILIGVYSKNCKNHLYVNKKIAQSLQAELIFVAKPGMDCNTRFKK